MAALTEDRGSHHVNGWNGEGRQRSNSLPALYFSGKLAIPGAAAGKPAAAFAISGGTIERRFPRCVNDDYRSRWGGTASSCEVRQIGNS
jgi:hypothetical protein